MTDQKIRQREAIAALPRPEFPEGKYRLIVADPPWSFSLRESDSSHRGRCGYPLMGDDEICKLQINEIAEKDSYLLLWFTKQHTLSAYKVAEAWGFTVRNFHTWSKVTKAGGSRMMLGHWGRNCEEHYLIATKGKCPSFTKLGITDMPSLFRAQVGRHSEKPQEFWGRTERLKRAISVQYDDCPAIELFARQEREGWDVWGNEINQEEAA